MPLFHRYNALAGLVLVALGGALFFGEKHVVQRVIGSVVVVSGVALLAVG